MKPTRRTQLTEQDLRVLQYEIGKTLSEAVFAILILILILFAWLDFWIRLQRFELFELLWIWEAVLATTVLGAGMFLSSSLVKRIKLNKDLKGGIKFIQKVAVVDRSVVVDKFKVPKSQKFYVWLKKRRRKNKYEVDHSLYSRLSPGQYITIEQAPYSKVMLKIHWY
jgi:hypothetical protein